MTIAIGHRLIERKRMKIVDIVRIDRIEHRMILEMIELTIFSSDLILLLMIHMSHIVDIFNRNLEYLVTFIRIIRFY